MLDFYKDRECFEVTASDNPGINPPAQVQLQLSVYTSIFSVAQMRLVPGDVEVEPGLLTIRDNDGKMIDRTLVATAIAGARYAHHF